MHAAVADTGPLRYLVLIEAIEILPRLFDDVLVPDVVQAELCHAHAPGKVRQWADAVPAWLTVVPTLPTLDPDLQTLDAGERAAIALAVAIQPTLILMDERAGVAIARARGLEVTGTLGLLDRAAQRDLIDLAGAFAELEATNFYLPKDLRDALLKRDRERRA